MHRERERPTVAVDLYGNRVARVGREASGGRGHVSRLALHFTERFVLLVLGDLLALAVALRLALLLRQDLGVMRLSVERQIGWHLLLMLTWGTFSCLFGSYDRRGNLADFRPLCAVAGAAGAAGFVFVLIPFLAPPLPTRRLDIAIFPLLATGGICAWRLAYGSAFDRPSFYRRALIVGTRSVAAYLATAIHEPGEQLGYRLLGLVEIAPPVPANAESSALPTLGGIADLPRLAALHRPDEIIVGMPQDPAVTGSLLPAILRAQEEGIRITTVTRVYEQVTGRLALQQVGQRFDLVVPLSVSGSHRFYLSLRRMTEIGISLCGCAITLALLPCIWLANRAYSPGPLFFRQERVGKGGKRFAIVKFRSMVADAEEKTGAVWATKGDPRITPVGRLLRKTRIDEFPQFWNVLKGDMGLVGPRPERPIFVEQLERAIPYYRVRHSVRPGLTGWAQVHYGYASSLDDSLTKLQYDLYYIKHQHVSLDLLIILRTAKTILGFRGR